MMQLPIDYRERPFKAKYIDEETHLFARWFIFGERSDGSGVDISDVNEDIVVGMSREDAERLLAARDRFCDAVVDILCPRAGEMREQGE